MADSHTEDSRYRGHAPPGYGSLTPVHTGGAGHSNLAPAPHIPVPLISDFTPAPSTRPFQRCAGASVQSVCGDRRPPRTGFFGAQAAPGAHGRRGSSAGSRCMISGAHSLCSCRSRSTLRFYHCVRDFTPFRELPTFRALSTFRELPPPPELAPFRELPLPRELPPPLPGMLLPLLLL